MTDDNRQDIQEPSRYCMRFFPVECASVTGTDFSCATFEQQGQWLNLMTYCANQENGGRIEGATELPEVFFQRSLAMRKEEFESECLLWTWDGQDLVVKFYPLQNQEKCQTLRENGREGGVQPGAVYESTTNSVKALNSDGLGE